MNSTGLPSDRTFLHQLAIPKIPFQVTGDETVAPSLDPLTAAGLQKWLLLPCSPPAWKILAHIHI